MAMRRNIKGLAALPAAALVVSAAVAPASAAPLVHEHFTESFSEVVEDFCDEITARIDEDATGTFLLNARGPDGLLYGQATVRRTLSFTNLANGKTFTWVSSFVDKDLNVTDNGDGTFTLITQFAGGTRSYGPDGQFLGADGEVFRAEILVDENGEFLDFLGVVKGELVDGCPEVLSHIG
jgi:hypothetical protein